MRPQRATTSAERASTQSATRPSLSHFDARLVALGIFLLSAYGTCPQRVAAADHTNRLRRGHPPTRHRGCTSTQEKRLTPPHPPRTGVRSGQLKGTLSACQSSREDRE